MMSPTLAVLLALVLLPSLYVIGLSLFSWNLIANSPQFVGLRNYDELLRDGQWWQSLIQTILSEYSRSRRRPPAVSWWPGRCMADCAGGWSCRWPSSHLTYCRQ